MGSSSASTAGGMTLEGASNAVQARHAHTLTRQLPGAPQGDGASYWNPKLENAENVLDEPRLEVDAAITARLVADQKDCPADS